MKYLKNLLILCFVIATGSSLGQAQESRCPLPLSHARAVRVPPELAKEVLRQAFKWMETPADEQKGIIQKAETGKEGISGLFCAQAIQVSRVGKPGLFIYGAEVGFSSYCNAQNCPVWIYRPKTSGYELLLEDVMVAEYEPEYNNIVVLRTSTNSYRDIKLTQHISAAQTGIRILKFDGRRYRARACMMETDVKGKKPRLTKMKCD